MKLATALLLLVLIAGGIGWKYRHELQARFMPPAPVAQQQPDVLYSWVDEDGVTHFEQQPGRGQRIIYDGSRVTPLEPVKPRAATAPAPEAVAGTVVEKSASTLHNLRNELKAGAQRMQEAKTAANL